MLIPAATMKDEIVEAFQKIYYTDDLFFESGSIDNYYPQIADEPDQNTCQFAIVTPKNRLIGYLSYKIDWYSSSVYDFGLISFDKGNIIIGKDLHDTMERFFTDYKLHRIEWRMVGGNPVERAYNRFCKEHGGSKVTLHDVIKDRSGKYHDIIIYEIINKGEAE